MTTLSMFQNRAPSNGNYELLAQEGGALRHWWFDRSSGKWNQGELFGNNIDAGAAMFQNTAPNNYHYEVVAHEQGNQLRHYWYGHESDGQWHEGQLLGTAGLCMSRPAAFGNTSPGNYNYEVVVRENNSLRHYWYNHLGDGQWHQGQLFSDEASGLPAMFQNHSPGNFNYEVLIPEYVSAGQRRLRHWYYNHLGDGQWHQAQSFAIGDISHPAAFQNHAPGNYNYEVVIVETTGKDHHLRHWYYNHLGDGQWHQAQAFGSNVLLPPASFQESAPGDYDYEVLVQEGQYGTPYQRYSYGHLTDGQWHPQEVFC